MSVLSTSHPLVTSPQLRVFVSSVVEGFKEYREAARKGVVAAGAHPVLANEDFPALNTSSRNACLDGIESCDYLVSIAGSRGGWTAPSGQLVVEEEFEYALKRNIPVFAFVQEASRDVEGERFVRRLSDYIDGRFRTSFTTPSTLQTQVKHAILERVGTFRQGKLMQPDLSSFFKRSHQNVSSMAKIRVVLTPERAEEVVDPVRITSPEFLRQLYELGHASHIKAFDFSQPKQSEFRNSTLSITQSDQSAQRGHGRYIRIEVSESGMLAIEADIARHSQGNSSWDMTSAFVLALEDVEMALSMSLAFGAALFDLLDPYKRHERFYFNVGLLGLGFRTLERNPQPRNSTVMSTRAHEDVLAYSDSRIISRSALTESASEVERAIALLSRKASE